LILQIWLSAAVQAARCDEDAARGAVLLAGVLDAGVRAQASRIATETHAEPCFISPLEPIHPDREPHAFRQRRRGVKRRREKGCDP
jgi:hypothetical protein